MEKTDLQGKAEIIISKQRNGPIGRINLVFLKNCTRFETIGGGGPGAARGIATATGVPVVLRGKFLRRFGLRARSRLWKSLWNGWMSGKFLAANPFQEMSGYDFRALKALNSNQLDN
jgi:hypothetical protein